MNFDEFIKLLNIAIPAGFSLVHIFQNQDSGETDVMILERGRDKAKNQQAIIAAWNAAHPGK